MPLEPRRYDAPHPIRPRRRCPGASWRRSRSISARSSRPSAPGTQIVSLFVTVTDLQRRLVPDLAAGRFRSPRQRQAAADRLLRQPVAADHRRRHARHERQHDRRDQVPASRRPNSSSSGCIPEDRGMVGAFNDKIEFGSARVHERSRRPDRRHEGTGLRQRHAAVRRRRGEPRTARGHLRTARHRCVFTDGEDTVEPGRPGHGHRTRPERRSDGLLDWPRERVLQRRAHGARQGRMEC